MNGKRGLGRIMSALLAASSMIGGASADTKKKTKNPDRAAAVLRDRKNRGRGKGGNERGNKRGEELGLSSSESGAVEWIKGHPKTSVVLGFAGLSAIGYGGYKGYKLWYNSMYNKYYRLLSREENFALYYNQVEQSKGKGRFKFEDGKVSEYRNIEGVDVIFSCGANGTKHRSLLSALTTIGFLSVCYANLTEYLSPVSLKSARIFRSFSEIENKFCEAFPGCSKWIKNVVERCRITEKYKKKFVDELVKYGERENKKMVVGENGELNVDRSA